MPALVGDQGAPGLLSISFTEVANGKGFVVKFLASTTNAAYDFLREQLEPLAPQLGSQLFAA
jgi:hypothetical protein